MDSPGSVSLPAVPEGRHFINGRFVAGSGSDSIEVLDPATESVIGEIRQGTAADIDEAVQAARAAFESPSWRRMLPLERERLIHRLADMVEADTEALSALESLDNGKARSIAAAVDLPTAAAWLRYMAGWPSKLGGETIPIASQPGQFHAYTARQPIGVCGLIVPWNFPLVLTIWKLAPALAAGNTVVIKPSELTPYTALKLAELVAKAGIPDGVVNIVTGTGSQTGAALVAHAGVDKISFTGSTGTGQAITRSAATTMKRVTLELGGKSPNIIFADADLEKAIPAAAEACFFNSGQLCFAGTRLLVERPVYDRVVAGVAAVSRMLKVGPGSEPDTIIGPVISGTHRAKIEAMIERGIASGAQLLAGGGRVGEQGYFLEPTVLGNITPAMELFQDEVFGPVLAVVPFDSEEEAVRLANDSRYGLAANVWTRDLARAHRVSGAIEAGTVWVNCHLAADPAMPFGGFKQSGWGRENGREVFNHYTEHKSVCIKLED